MYPLLICPGQDLQGHPGAVRLGSALSCWGLARKELVLFLSWELYLCRVCFPSRSLFTASPLSPQAWRDHHAGAFRGGPAAVDGGDGWPGAGEH